MTNEKSNSKATKEDVKATTTIPISIDKKEGIKEKEDIHIHIPQAEYDALINERDQLRANLYVIATRMKDSGFNVSEQGYGLQRMGTDIINTIRLSPKQKEIIEKQIASQ